MNPIKSYLLNKYKKAYMEEKQYYDRFFLVFVMFFIISLAAQSISAWSEFKYFHYSIVGVEHEYSFQFAVVLNLLFEVFKAMVISKFMTEFLGKKQQLNVLFLTIFLVLMGGSVYMSLNGSTHRAHESVIKPTDERTAQTDKVFEELIAAKKKELSQLRKKYTYEGNYYMPPTGNKYFTSKEIKADRKALKAFEGELSTLLAEHAAQRGADQQFFRKSLEEYQEDLTQKIVRNKYIVVFSEALYLVCMVYMFIFGYRSAIDFFGNDPEGNGNPKKKIASPLPAADPEHEEITEELPTASLGNMRIHKNEKQPSPPESVTDSHIHTRQCAIEGCTNEFEVNPRETKANPRKYCDSCKVEQKRQATNQIRQRETIAPAFKGPRMFDDDEYGEATA